MLPEGRRRESLAIGREERAHTAEGRLPAVRDFQLQQIQESLPI